MDLLDINEQLQNEGQRLLESNGLLDSLSSFGYVDIGGSFTYGTMVDRDIDIAVVVESQEDINLSALSAIVELIVNTDGCTGIELSDRKSFPKPSRPKGVWFGARFMFEGREWGIDIWLVTKDEPLSHINLELHRRMKSITENQRLEIIDLKYKALIDGSKVKGQTSAEIYKKVLGIA